MCLALLPPIANHGSNREYDSNQGDTADEIDQSVKK
jgi:hypothetical protein